MARREQRQISVEGRIETYSGPLPQAAELKAYSEVAPEFPNRIVAMAEKEQEHRHTIEKKRTTAQIWITGAGQVFGFVLALCIIGIAGMLIMHDKPIAGFVTLLTGLATLIGPFLYRARVSRTLDSPTQR